MCWATGFTLNKQVANRDIPVFKIVNESLRSVYQNFPYKLNRRYYQDFRINISGQISEGFHSYSEKVKVNVLSSLIQVRSDKLSLDYFRPKQCFRILECIIPKDASYYENEHGEIVSDVIIPIKIKEIE